MKWREGFEWGGGPFSDLKWEVPRQGQSEFTGKNSFDVKGQQHVNNAVDRQHDEDVSQREIVIGGDTAVDIVPLDSLLY